MTTTYIPPNVGGSVKGLLRELFSHIAYSDNLTAPDENARDMMNGKAKK